MTPKTSIINTRFGQYLVWLTDKSLIDRIIHNESSNQPEKIILISELIIENSKNKTTLDVGANAGIYSIPLAKKYPDTSFYCFEVQRLVYYQLCGNIFLNNLENVFAYNFAVGAKNCFTDIPMISYLDHKNVGGYSIDVSITDNLAPEHLRFGVNRKMNKAVIRSIDSFSELPKAGLIKIDVEGLELEVLQGAENFIRLSGFPPILFEAWDYDWYRPKREKLFNFLYNLGYDYIPKISADDDYLAQNTKSSDFLLEIKLLNSGSTQVTTHKKK